MILTVRCIPIILLLFVTASGVDDTKSDDSTANSEGRPVEYTPVPDGELFRAIRRLPNVTESTLKYTDELGTSNTYQGNVALTDDLTSQQLRSSYDEISTILRHGHWRASITMQVFSGKDGVTGSSLDLFGFDDYERRYGPQTGEKGWPPPFVPN